MDQDEASPKGATRAWTEEEKVHWLLLTRLDTISLIFRI